MDATKRGERDRKKEVEKFEGEPLAERQDQAAGNTPTNTPRDKGVEPAKDVRRDGHGAEDDAP